MKTFEQRIRNMSFKSILLKLVGSCALYFAPVATITHAVLALLAIDWITGVWKSLLVKRRITSFRLRKSTNKTVAYILAIISVHILEESILKSSYHLPQIVAAYIGFTETISIYENLSEITGKKFLKELADTLINQIKKKFKT